VKSSHTQSTVECWFSILSALAAGGSKYVDQDNKDCREFQNYTLVIDDASDATAVIQAIRRAKSALYPSIEEFYTLTFSVDSATFDWSIGNRLFGDTSQIDAFVIPLLKQHPNSRRAIALCYDPKTDSHCAAANVPSLVLLQFRVIDHKLELAASLRSCDAYLGLPANIWQARAIQEYVATKLNLTCGSLTLIVSSLHWFSDYSTEAQATVASVRRLMGVSHAARGPTK